MFIYSRYKIQHLDHVERQVGVAEKRVNTDKPKLLLFEIKHVLKANMMFDKVHLYFHDCY